MRIRFTGPSGDDGPGLTFLPALFYVGDGPEQFDKAFTGIGVVWVVPAKNGKYQLKVSDTIENLFIKGYMKYSLW